MAHEHADVQSELVDLTGIPLDQLRSSTDPLLADSVRQIGLEAERQTDPVRMSSSKDTTECPNLVMPDVGHA